MAFRSTPCTLERASAVGGLPGRVSVESPLFSPVALACIVALHVALAVLLWLGQPPRVPPLESTSIVVSLEAAPAARPVVPTPAPPSPLRPTPTPPTPAALPRLATPERGVRFSPARTEASPAPTLLPSNAPMARAEPQADRAEPVSAPRFDAAYLQNPPPPYPPLSRKAREQGTVLLRVQVDEQGRAQEVRVQSSSGHERLDRAAEGAVARWSFAPARQSGRPVTAWVQVPLIFALKD